MPSNPTFADVVRAVWQRASSRLVAYAPVLPGDPSFICQPDVCNAHCCRAFSVALSDADVERLARFTARDPRDLLEVVDGELLVLPTVTPYLLRRREGRCAELSPDRSCGVYHGRPDACRLYPHQVILLDSEGVTPWREDATRAGPAIAAALRGDAVLSGPIAVLARQTECPGFTGPVHTDDTWRALLREVASIQFPGLVLPAAS